MSTKKTEALKYKDLISKSEQQIQSEELDLKVQESKSHLEVTIATTKRDLARAKQDLAKTQSQVPYNVHAEIDAQANVDSLQYGLEYAERILKERF